jgi:cleavage and polyadenylation specificity factor subunit 1
VLLGTGTKLIVHSYDGQELTPVAFFDTPLHTVTINVVKNFILMGDIQKGAHFFRCNPQTLNPRSYFTPSTLNPKP